MPRRTRSLTFESLENRELLAANDILIEKDVLGVRGTSGNDVIEIIRIDPGPNSDGQFQIRRNGDLTIFHDSNVTIRDILILGLAGDDQISVDPSVKIP